MDPLSNAYPTTVADALRSLYDRIILYVPNILVALIVLILGWLIGIFLGDIVKRILVAIKIDTLADRLGLSHLSQRAGRTLSISQLGKWLVKWFFFLGSIIAAAEILGLTQVTQFFYTDVLGYAGHVIVAMVILLLGILAANFFSSIVETAVKASGFGTSGALATITRWAILIFAFLAALSELQIAAGFLQDLFRAVVAMLAVAGGLAFGLGGRDHAKKVLDSLESGLTKHS